MTLRNTVSFVFIINLLLTGCSEKGTHSSQVSSEKETINVKCIDGNSSWEIKGEGTVSISGYTYLDNEEHELFSEEYQITEPLTFSVTMDDDMNLSVYDSVNKSTQLYKTGMEGKEDTGYIFDGASVLKKEKSVPLFLKCRNMTSIQSDFEDDYKTLKAEWAVVVVMKRV